MRTLFQKLAWHVIQLAVSAEINQLFVQVAFQLHKILNITMIPITSVSASVHHILISLEMTVLTVTQEQIVQHAIKLQATALHA